MAKGSRRDSRAYHPEESGEISRWLHTRGTYFMRYTAQGHEYMQEVQSTKLTHKKS